jgi:hypothetical protein
MMQPEATALADGHIPVQLFYKNDVECLDEKDEPVLCSAYIYTVEICGIQIGNHFLLDDDVGFDRAHEMYWDRVDARVKKIAEGCDDEDSGPDS